MTTGPTASDGGRVEDASIGVLFGNVTRDLSDLVRQELALARAEVRQEARRTRKAATALGAAIVAAHLALIFGSVALWTVLSRHLSPAWAAAVLAAGWGAAASILYLNATRLARVIGRKRET